MPPTFDLEYYARLKPAPGTGPGRLLALNFAMALRDLADRWELGPDAGGYGADSCYFISGTRYALVPPPLAIAAILARFLRQFVGGNGPLTLQLGERQLAVSVLIEPCKDANRIVVELPVSSAMHGPAASLLEEMAEHLVEFEDAEFETEVKHQGPRDRFQFRAGMTTVLKPFFLGRGREPFHPGMHAPTKFLMLVLLMCLRDGAMEVEFLPAGVELWARYLVDRQWYDFQPVPRFVWPQLVRVVERHATLTRPPSEELAVPAVGWLELRFGQDLPPDNLAVFLDPRKENPLLRINFMRVAPTPSQTMEPQGTSSDDNADSELVVEFSPDDE